MQSWIKNNVLYLAWAQALAAMFGSLYFSEIMHYPPCSLCWYQRILIYPLVVIVPAGILIKDKKLPIYVLPFTLAGIIMALYHQLLQVGIISEQLAPCGLGISCKVNYFNLFNIISLPLLSLAAFAFITVCMLIFLRSNRKL